MIKQKAMSGSINDDSIEVEIKKELNAVMDSSANSVTAVLLGYKKKPEEVTRVIRQPSASPPTPRASRRKDSSSSSGSDGREASYTIGTVTENSRMAAKRSSPAQQWSPMNRRAAAKISSSDGVASAIQQILTHKKNSPEVKGPDKMGSKPASGDTNGISVTSSTVTKDVSKSDRSSTKSSPDAPQLNKGNKTSNSQSTTPAKRPKEGGVAETRALFERLSSHSLMEVPLREESNSESADKSSSNPTDNPSGGLSRGDSMLSDILSSEGTVTDVESSLDVVSPLGIISARFASDNPQKGSWSTSDSNILLDKKKKVSYSAQNIIARDDFNILEEDEEDAVGEMQEFNNLDMRARTSTVSGSLLKGAAKVGIGRKRLKDQRKENLLMKRATSQIAPGAVTTGHTDFLRDMDAMKHSFELLSPQLEVKIKNMALRKMYETYGGKDVVKHAVHVIVQAWQSYRLRKRFQERLREKSQNRAKMRERAKSMKNVHRRPSILQKGGRGQYRKVNLSSTSENRDVGKTSGLVTADPMTRMKEKADRLGKERIGHTHSGARLELMEKKRSSLGTTGDKADVMKKGSSVKESHGSSVASIFEEDSIDLSRVGEMVDRINSVEDSVFVPEKSQDKRHTLVSFN